MSSPPPPLTDEEFTSAVELLRRIIPDDDFPAFSLEVSPATVYTSLVTLWMLTLQRLGGGKSMTAIIKDVLAFNRELLPNNKRVRDGTLSEKSGAYSQARKRLPIETVKAFAECVSQSLIDQSPPWLNGRRAFIIDGTTMPLSPTSALRFAYPPATNQYGETVWPIMMLMVAHELQSGCALIPEFGPQYGPNNTSEARQAIAIAQRIPAGSLVLADGNFGIFQVAHAMIQDSHDILFRLTKSRFESMRRKATKIQQSASGTTYRLSWTPSPRDRKTNPGLPPDACLVVILHDIALKNGGRLYLVTTLDVSCEIAAKFYGRRYDVEHDIRDMKVALGLENIKAKSDEMVQKELFCGVVAYNLVMELRRQAAKIAKVEPRRLSFTGVWTTMQAYLLQQPPCSASEWQERYEKALRSAARAKLPNRPDRSYARQAHPHRAKSTKFMKAKAAGTQITIPEKPK